jgi:hypothetical protein
MLERGNRYGWNSLRYNMDSDNDIDFEKLFE